MLQCRASPIPPLHGCRELCCCSSFFSFVVSSASCLRIILRWATSVEEARSLYSATFSSLKNLSKSIDRLPHVQSPIDDQDFTASLAFQALDFRKSARFPKPLAQPEAG